MDIEKNMHSCGIMSVNKMGYITLNSEMEKEIKLIVESIRRNKNLKDRCIFCTHFKEYENDYCDILNKKVLFCDSCDKINRRKDIADIIKKEIISLEEKEIELNDKDL
jgi:hypothetical protein